MLQYATEIDNQVTPVGHPRRHQGGKKLPELAEYAGIVDPHPLADHYAELRKVKGDSKELRELGEKDNINRR